LGAVIDTSTKAHDIALIYHNGILIATFGIRRGSRKSLGHGHIPGALHLRPNETLRLANCPLSREEWIQRLIDQGLIEGEGDRPEARPTP
jgi:hypothetical protein